jgi:CHAD domain-containing protein
MKTAAPEAFAAELARQVRKSRRRYRDRWERCRRKFSGPAVHELRIATRRMLAVTELLAALGAGTVPAKARRTFKRRLEAFGPLRDVQVQRELFAPLGREFPVVGELERWLRKRERKLIRELQREVKSLRQGRLEGRLKQVEKELGRLNGAAAGRLRPRVVTVVNRAFARVSGLVRRLRAERPATIHRLRIAFKHHRYLCELLHPLWPGVAGLNLKAMHRFQLLMGHIQDCEVMLAGIAEAVSAERLRPAEVAGLNQAVRARRARRIKAFLDNIASLREFQPKTRPEDRSA